MTTQADIENVICAFMADNNIVADVVQVCFCRGGHLVGVNDWGTAAVSTAPVPVVLAVVDVLAPVLLEPNVRATSLLAHANGAQSR